MVNPDSENAFISHWQGMAVCLERDFMPIELKIYSLHRPTRPNLRGRSLWPGMRLSLTHTILTRFRLDDMHQGIKTYLDGKFFLAPLDDPQTILDIGYALNDHLHLASLMSLLSH